MIKLILSILVCTYSIFSFGQVVEGASKPSDAKILSEITKENLIQELQGFDKKDIKVLEREIVDFNKKVSLYIQNRDKECKGNFSSIEINSKGESEVVTRKLSRSEIKLCHLELIYFRKKYVNEIFKIRKKILVEEQAKQLENLDQIRLKSIQSLEQLANKLAK